MMLQFLRLLPSSVGELNTEEGCYSLYSLYKQISADECRLQARDKNFGIESILVYL